MVPYIGKAGALSLCLLSLTHAVLGAHIQQSALQGITKPLPFIVLHEIPIRLQLLSGVAGGKLQSSKSCVIIAGHNVRLRMEGAGIGDQCSNPGISNFVTLLAKATSAEGRCMEIGNGAEDSWTLRLDWQAEEVCRQVKQTPLFADGFNLVGLSQGALIGRAYIQWCDGGPAVHNLISLGGPHAGVASTPRCGFSFLCRFIDLIIQHGVYTAYVQDNVAPAGYVKIPNVSSGVGSSGRWKIDRAGVGQDLGAYYRGCAFLPRLNNEVASERNVTYSRRFGALNHLTLVMFTSDTVVVPKETAHFGFYAENSFGPAIPVKESALYKEDWIGLRTLDEAGRVSFLMAPGDHLHITAQVVEEAIVPFLIAKEVVGEKQTILV